MTQANQQHNNPTPAQVADFKNGLFQLFVFLDDASLQAAQDALELAKQARAMAVVDEDFTPLNATLAEYLQDNPPETQDEDDSFDPIVSSMSDAQLEELRGIVEREMTGRELYTANQALRHFDTLAA